MMQIRSLFNRPRTYRLNEELVNEIRRTSKILGCTDSDLVRKLLSEGIEKMKDRFAGR